MQGYNDASFHGSEIQTPFLDSLNHAGVELRNYYGHMICTPSRSAIMSGRYAFTTGMQHSFWGTGQDGGLPLKFKTMADHLRECGYSTHMVGKVRAARACSAPPPSSGPATA
jgi:arylsulfatase B